MTAAQVERAEKDPALRSVLLAKTGGKLVAGAKFVTKPAIAYVK